MISSASTGTNSTSLTNVWREEKSSWFMVEHGEETEGVKVIHWCSSGQSYCRVSSNPLISFWWLTGKCSLSFILRSLAPLLIRPFTGDRKCRQRNTLVAKRVGCARSVWWIFRLVRIWSCWWSFDFKCHGQILRRGRPSPTVWRTAVEWPLSSLPSFVSLVIINHEKPSSRMVWSFKGLLALKPRRS